MRTYKSFEEIDFELKRINLERKIIWEELKLSGHNVQDSLTPNSWLAPILGVVKKFGLMFLLKKMFR